MEDVYIEHLVIAQSFYVKLLNVEQCVVIRELVELVHQAVEVVIALLQITDVVAPVPVVLDITVSNNLVVQLV